MKYILFISLAFLLLPSFAKAADIVPKNMLVDIIFYHEFSEYKLPLSKNIDFFVKENTLQSNQKLFGEDAVCVLEKDIPVNENTASVAQESRWIIDTEKLRNFFVEYVEPKINRSPENIRIFRNEEGAIEFEGVARFGQKLNTENAIAFVQKAVQEGISRIELPVDILNPPVTVEDEELKNMGVQELISVGESDFSGSTLARMNNIEVGSSRYNGYLIPQGKVASFNEQLGAVDSKHGYVKELVILGDRVDKEYGGGLCQVSSTAFRAALLAGLPIVERYPHSFAVSYYEPWGTDATIYPGSKDLKFKNDTNGAILMQTFMNRETKKLQFLFYGTKDNRKVKMFGSQIGKHVAPLAPRHETSAKIPAGELQRLSTAVAGFDASWLRVVIPDSLKSDAENKSEKPLSFFYSFFSRYTPRRDWTVRGVSLEEKASEEPTI